MITFYPRNIGMWRHIINFESPKGPSINFEAYPNFLEFLVYHGAIKDDHAYPFSLYTTDMHDHLKKLTGHQYAYTAKQWTVIGWLTSNIELPAKDINE